MKTWYFALLCALIVFSQMLQADCEKQRKREKERANAGGGGRPEPGSNRQNRRGERTRGQKGSPKGKFTSKEKAECTWALSEAENAGLKINCKKEGRHFSCEFVGNPSTCSQYSGNRNAFWKQITRSLKKQKNICEDPKSILKSKVCKRGPSSAHLRLVMSPTSRQEDPVQHGRETTVAAVPSIVSRNQTESKNCTEDVDYINQRKVAEEYCSESWLSVCHFFFSMVQDNKCK